MQSPSETQAVVIGGSMAGMLTAAILSRHFNRVFLLENDRYPAGAIARDGVPQARHLHALLTGGHRIVEEFFPGITEQWRRAGAELLDVANDFAWRTPAGWGVRFNSGIEMLAASRALIDFVVQRKVASLRNVIVMENARVLGLIATEGGPVGGVHYRDADGIETALTADLTVDASGRMSRTPDWLMSIGYNAPAETVVDARLGYASRLYYRTPEHEKDWRAAFIQAAPPKQPRAGIALPVEGRRWIVTLCGGGGDYAPNVEAEFLAFARSLPSGEIYNLIRHADPAGPIVSYRRTENRWRHYERLRKWPHGFAVIGDAACAFNPVYGQGITTAAMQARALDGCLRAGGTAAVARKFRKDVARIIATPWALATGEDLRYEGMQGNPTFADRALQKYVNRVMRVSTHNSNARRPLLEVFTMLAQPQRLLKPDVMARVLLDAVSPKDAIAHDRPVLDGSASGAAA